MGTLVFWSDCDIHIKASLHMFCDNIIVSWTNVITGFSELTEICWELASGNHQAEKKNSAKTIKAFRLSGEMP